MFARTEELNADPTTVRVFRAASPVELVSESASLSGTIFKDADFDGAVSAADVPWSATVGGVEAVNDVTGEVVVGDIDSSGNYLFDSLVPGTYNVSVTAPASDGWSRLLPQQTVQVGVGETLSGQNVLYQQQLTIDLVDDSATISFRAPAVTVNVTENDSITIPNPAAAGVDLDGIALGSLSPSYGSAALVAPTGGLLHSDIRYVPASVWPSAFSADLSYTDEFTYRYTNALGDSEEATVTVTVTRNPSTLVFDANGGTGSMTTVSGGESDAPVLPNSTFVRPGFTFTGWNTSSNGSGTSYAPGDSFTLASGTNSLFAQWSADAATLIFDANGGSGTTPFVPGVNGQAVVVPASGFARQGFTFTGWNTTAIGDGTSYQPGEMFTLEAGANALFAQWQALPASLEYIANGGAGTTMSTTGVTDQTVSVAASTFTRAGYTFAGWNTSANGSGTSLAPGGSFRLPPGVTTAYAQWLANPATLAYGSNGGKGSTAPTGGLTDEIITVADNGFTRDGYLFLSWNEAADGSGATYSPGDDFTLRPGTSSLQAQWLAQVATLAFDANGGSGEMPMLSGTTDEVLNLPSADFARVGFTFAGWNTKADGTGTSLAPGGQFALPPGDTTLFAKWSANRAAVRYDANGGKGTTPETVGVTDQIVTVAASKFSRSGHVFVGWNTEPNGAGKSLPPGQKMTLRPRVSVLYAQWATGEAAVTYDANGGSGITAPSTGSVGEMVTIAENGFVREGYSFVGWNTESDGTGKRYLAGDSISLPTDGIALYAQWERTGGLSVTGSSISMSHMLAALLLASAGGWLLLSSNRRQRRRLM
jgi:uncharacterized repeat protein (TIGR02543 family)